jgi:RecA/RadA recombinase
MKEILRNNGKPWDEIAKKLLNTVTIMAYVSFQWCRKLVHWLKYQQYLPKWVMPLSLLVIEGLGKLLWGWVWFAGQVLIMLLLAYWQKPVWLVNMTDDQPDCWLLPTLLRFNASLRRVAGKMRAQPVLRGATFDKLRGYDVPVLTVPYAYSSPMQIPLADKCYLDNGIVYAKDNELVFDVEYLRDSDRQSFVQRLADADVNQSLPEVAEILAEKRKQKAAEDRAETEQMIGNVVKQDKSKAIINTLMTSGLDWGIAVWNLNNGGIQESNNALLVRVRLVRTTTIADLRKALPEIAKAMRIKVTMAELADKGSANLIFHLRNDYTGKQLTVQEVEDNARLGRFELGMGDLGPIALKLPKSDFPATLIGGLSRSGKSTLATMLIISLLSLKTTGKRTYADVFIGTVKDEDYKALGWNKQGMYIAGTPSTVYEMLRQVDKICTERKQKFVKSGVVNISQYNQQHPDNPMTNILVIVDEYANLLSRSEGETVEVAGKDVKLSTEIERLSVKLTQEHISRGCTLVVITQNFAKNAVGKLFDTVGARIIGFATTNVAASLDNTGELAKAMRGQEQSRKGLFFVNSPDLVPTKDTMLATMNNGYYQVRTNYLDTVDVASHFAEKYETAARYMTNTTEATATDLPFINI